MCRWIWHFGSSPQLARDARFESVAASISLDSALTKGDQELAAALLSTSPSTCLHVTPPWPTFNSTPLLTSLHECATVYTWGCGEDVG